VSPGIDLLIRFQENLFGMLSHRGLKMSTSKPAELLKLSGPRNPYPGDLGVVKEGAYADLLLVEGNPLEDLGAVTDTENLKIIMKDRKIYKNTVK